MPLDTQGELARLDQANVGVDTQQHQLTADIAKSGEGRQAETAPLLKQVGDTQGEQAQFLERRQGGRPVIPEFKAQPPVSAKEYEGLSFALIGMAMVGGLASKGNWLGASYALNGAMKGFIEGNHDLAEKNYKDYEHSFKAAVAKENSYIKETDEVLKAKDLSINQKLTQVRIIASKYDKQDMLIAGRQKSLDGIRKSIEGQRTSILKMQERNDEVQMRVDAQRDAARERADTMKAVAAMRNSGGGAPPGAGGLSEKYNADPTYKQQVDFWAKYVAGGNTLPPRFAQSGAGKMMFSDIVSKVPQLNSGNPGDIAANKLTMRQMNSEAQKIGTQSASVAIAANELLRFIPLAEKAIDNVHRTGWRPLNSLIQAGENTWSPDQKELVVANRSVQNAYAQVIQRGAPTVHSLAEAEKMLNSADSPKVYKAAMKQLVAEVKAAEAGLVDAASALRERAKNMGTEAPSRRAGDSKAPAPPAGFKEID